MTLVTGTSPVSSDTDANFRLFANAASALLNGTLVKTSDTGQMTFPYAGAKPAAINTVVGYEVFRFNDAQQANLPIYMKVEYGVGATVATPGLFITIGQGTDGAGTITNTLMARIFAGRSGAVATTNHDCGASSGEGYFALGMGLGITSSSEVFLFINRSMAADGTPDARAIYVFLPNLTNFVQQTSMKVPGLQAQRSSSTSGPGFPVNSAGPQNDNTNEIVSLAGDVPVFPFEPHLGKRQPPLLMAVVVHQSDVGNGVIFTTEMYGATRKFRRFTGGQGSYVRGSSSAASSTPCLAMRWE